MFKTILAIVLFVVSGGLIFAYVSPTYSAAQDTLAERAKYTEANAKVREVASLRSALTAKYQQLSPQNIARLQSFLPDHVDNIKLVLDIDNVAQRRGIRIGNVVTHAGTESAAPGGAAPATSLGFDTAAQDLQKYKSLVLDFNVVASYSDFILFMRDLEQSLRIVDLVSLKMEPSSQRTSVSNIPLELRGLAGATLPPPASSDFQYAVSIKTYWLP
jgi:Tfp pilus assembly protein PilO